MHFRDHFSGHAELYARARPHYPDALFDWIAAEAPARVCAWDAGCGNGQASVALVRHFEHVVATDPSEKQLGMAVTHARVDYRNEPAEHTSIAGHSIDTVTVAQALHWFDLSHFADEVRRVAKPGALLAAWSYAGFRVTPAVDAVVARLYGDILGAYWAPERRLVEDGYASLALPFHEIETPAFDMRNDWNARQWLAYLTSWSAAQRHLESTGHDAIADAEPELITAWGDPARLRPVHWQLVVRAWRVA